jgi:hypothetical protein
LINFDVSTVPIHTVDEDLGDCIANWALVVLVIEGQV